MHSRRARQLASTQLAADARLLASQTDQLDDLPPADQVRMCRAFEALAHELEVRAGVVPRAPRTAPVDPDQVSLFKIDREDEDDVVRSEEAG
jgi:hypothetical protein